MRSARNSHARRRGTVLITTMVVSFALAGSVIVLCRSMRVEMQASANQAAALQASAVERGAEQYVLALLAEQKDQLHEMSEDEFAAIPVGAGYFWLLRPDYDDATMPLFGLVEENAKLNLNSADYDQLARLPGMTYPAASSIMDWKDADQNTERDGAETDYYLSLPEPYYCKDAPFESVEELLLVREFYRDMLYGDGSPLPPLGQPHSARDAGMGAGVFTDPMIARGMFDLLTVYSSESGLSESGAPQVDIRRFDRSSVRRQVEALLTQALSASRAREIVTAAGQQRMTNVFDLYVRGKMKPDEFDAIADGITTIGANDTAQRVGWINVKTAPRSVLLCIEQLDETDVDNIIAARSSIDMTTAKLGWFAQALGEKANTVTTRVTYRADQFSADILAASGNGRSFKRVRIVVDTAGGTPQIVYRRDITDRGWPMDRSILQQLREGQALATGQARNTLPGGSGSRF